MGWFRRILLLFSLVNLLLVAESAHSKQLYGSEVCVASRYCSEDNAVRALIRETDLTERDARKFLEDRDRTHPTWSCSCHDSCVFFDVCCEDKESQIPDRLKALGKRLLTDPKSYKCETVFDSELVIVSACPDGVPPALNDRCTEVLKGDEESLEVKVTSASTGLTYKNLYCGMCNSEKLADLKSWVWNFDCSGVPNINRQKLSGSGIRDIAQSIGCQLNATIPTAPLGDGDIHHRIGVYIDTLSLCNAPPIRTCPVGTDNETRKRCEEGSNAFMSFNEKVYKNIDCLACNEGNSVKSSATCESCETENCNHSDSTGPKGILQSFGVLVQPYPTGTMLTCKQVDGQECNGIFTDLPTCGNGKFLNYRSATCEDICPQGSYYLSGECVFSEHSMHCSNFDSYGTFRDRLQTPNITHILHGNTYLLAGREATNCYNCTYLVITSEFSHFHVTEDGLVTYNGNPIPVNFVYKKNETSWYVCLDQAHVIEEIITGVLLSVSLVCLILYFCAYILLKRLRNVPGKIVAGNMLCLFFAYVLFLLRSALTEYSLGCTIFAILIHYFLLASFMFNIIYASFIVHSLEFIDFESSVNHWTAIRMWILGLLLPFLVVIPGLIVDTFDNNPYRPEYGGKECFLMNINGRLIFFIAPIALCLIVAVILYIIIIIKLIQIARATSQVRSNHKEKVAIAMKLVIVLGFNWIFAVAAAATSHPVLLTIFIITCTLQGFFGFIVFICNKATLKDIRKYCGKKSSLNVEMPSSTTSRNATVSTDLTKTLIRTNDQSAI